jgi:hypothetical protein
MKQVKYPTARPFTLKEVHARIQNGAKSKGGKGITYVGLYLKVQRDVKAGVLETAGNKKKHKKGKGRPQVLYTVVNKPAIATTAAAVVVTQTQQPQQ